MTDAELQGIAAQAFNMARLDMERGPFGCLLACCHRSGLFRMTTLESVLEQKLGKGWLNSGRGKDLAFGLIREATSLMPPDAIVIATVINKFEATEKFWELPLEEQFSLRNSSHNDHHKAVAQGLFDIHDALMCCVQTAQRVCLYTRRFDQDKAETTYMDQSEFGGRLKMYGADPKEGHTPDDASEPL